MVVPENYGDLEETLLGEGPPGCVLYLCIWILYPCVRVTTFPETRPMFWKSRGQLTIDYNRREQCVAQLITNLNVCLSDKRWAKLNCHLAWPTFSRGISQQWRRPHLHASGVFGCISDSFCDQLLTFFPFIPEEIGGTKNHATRGPNTWTIALEWKNKS